MMRRIGFGLRFSALVIDVFIIIVIVFALNMALAKSLYSTIGVMKKASISDTTPVSQILNNSFTGGQAEQTVPQTPNSVQNRNEQTQASTQPETPREQRTRYALPSSEPQPVESESANTTTPTPPVITTEAEKLNKLAEEKPRGYIHNSKDFIKIFFFAIISILYFLIEGFFGTGPGKILLRLKILNNDRSNVERKNLLIRFLYKMGIPCFIVFIYSLTKINFFWTLGMIAFFLVTVGCFFVFSNTFQAIHDRLAKTAVFSLFLKEHEDEEQTA